MKEKPRFVDGPHVGLTQQEMALGHNGTAVIAGIVDETGHFLEPIVKASSMDPELDRRALEAAASSRFTPARNAAGTAIAVPVAMPFEFYASQSNVAGGGLVHYGCGQFVRDTDWWKSVHQAAPWSDYKLYTFMVGFSVLSAQGTMVERFAHPVVDVAIAWPAWIEACRRQPDAPFVDQLGPLREAVYTSAGLSPKRKR